MELNMPIFIVIVRHSFPISTAILLFYSFPDTRKLKHYFKQEHFAFRRHSAGFPFRLQWYCNRHSVSTGRNYKLPNVSEHIFKWLTRSTPMLNSYNWEKLSSFKPAKNLMSNRIENPQNTLPSRGLFFLPQVTSSK